MSKSVTQLNPKAKNKQEKGISHLKALIILSSWRYKIVSI